MMDEQQKKAVVDSLRERPDSVSSRFEEYGLEKPATLTDDQAAEINRRLEDSHDQVRADD